MLSGNRPTLPWCSKEVLSFADYILMTLNVNDDDIDDEGVGNPRCKPQNPYFSVDTKN